MHPATPAANARPTAKVAAARAVLKFITIALQPRYTSATTKRFLESQSTKKGLRFRNPFTGRPTLAAFLLLRLGWEAAKSTFYKVFHKSALYQFPKALPTRRA